LEQHAAQGAVGVRGEFAGDVLVPLREARRAPHGSLGERVVGDAFLLFRRGQLVLDGLDELREHCRKDLAAYKVPKHVEFILVLPKSTVGKVLRRKLVEAHCAEAAA
ncbi:long-chain fatty acid--CoA ligase, partial [Candidatus Roizmanbacteria bacterium]|nr:long-chain fatty acid--CoA ligase [Candidatus Roizmanbacteria bacterium]